MKMYQQSLEIKEGLGDLKGKASTLAMLGQLLVMRKDYPRAIMALVESLQTLSSIGARPAAQQVAEIRVSVRQNIGVENFDNAWKEITDQPLPDWLSQPIQQEQGMTVEQFIAGAIQSAREKRPAEYPQGEAEQYFKEAQKMPIDSNAPAELQSLGVVLQRIMIVEKNVDASRSALTEELREMVEKAIHE
ncbi:MAG: hypothetical protein Q7J80_06610 [Anaerolineales bacterium]|nr:hypothetical protein [Anaerolineales bacterium]